MSNLKVYAKTIEDEALEQINTLLSQDAFKDCKVRICLLYTSDAADEL